MDQAWLALLDESSKYNADSSYGSFTCNDIFVKLPEMFFESGAARINTGSFALTFTTTDVEPFQVPSSETAVRLDSVLTTILAIIPGSK